MSNRLGDRHGENLSFEEGTGGILHVDFNCLFDKVRKTGEKRLKSQRRSPQAGSNV